MTGRRGELGHCRRRADICSNRYVSIRRSTATKHPNECLLRRRTFEIVAVAKAAKGKVVKAAATAAATTTATAAITAAMDHVPAGGMADTATGVAAAPGIIVDKVMPGGDLAPMAHPLRIQGTMIVSSHR